MTERDDHIFDQKIRKKLTSYEEPVSDDIWENISKRRTKYSFLLTNYKWIVGVFVMSMLALAVTIPKIYKSKTEKVQSYTEAGISNDLVKTASIIGQLKNNIQQTKTKINTTEENKESYHKETIQSVPKESISKIIKVSDNKTTSSQDETNVTKVNQPESAKKGITNNEPKANNPPVSIIISNEPTIIIPSNTEPIIQTISNTFNTEVSKPEITATDSADNQTAQLISEKTPENTFTAKPIVQIQAVDSSSAKQPENATAETIPFKTHIKFLDFVVSSGMVNKSIKASDPASGSYVRMLDRVTKTKYSIGFELRYRYYFNDCWNISTGLMYNQVKEQMTGQTKPGQITLKQTTATIISPFDPPKQVIIKTDTLREPAKTISQTNTFSYLRVPLLLGAKFEIFKIPFNLYAGVGYFYSIIQKGAYINSSTYESVEFKKSINNPYKRTQGVNFQTGLNANIKLTNRCYFLIGGDYSRFTVSINDSKHPFQQYYSIWNINMGISYQLF